MSTFNESLIAVLSLATGEQKTLVEGGSNPIFAPTGHIVYARAGSLMAVPFDPDILEVTGPSFAIFEGVSMSVIYGAAHFSFSSDGTLVYIPGGPNFYSKLVWVDRSGQFRPVPLTPRFYYWARFSPDGRRLAICVGGANDDVWLYELERQI
jgi:serine/threonine-protein kinase